MKNEYEQGQQDMLALIKDAYYKADKSEFERLLDAEDENEVQNFLRCDYIKQGMSIERDRLLREIKELADRYGIDIYGGSYEWRNVLKQKHKANQ
jgi:hypothetical protein